MTAKDTTSGAGPHFAPDSKEWSGPPSAPYAPKSGAHASRYSGFKCYYRSTTGRKVPVKGGHWYSNGMYPTRIAAFAAAERECMRLNAEHPERRYQVYEI